MATVSQLLAIKGSWVHTVRPNTSAFEAIAKMSIHNIGALLVVEQRTIRGLFTERDFLRRVALEGRASRTTFVEEVMSRDLITVSPETDVEACMRIMTEQRIRHLPVLRGSELRGLISIGDIVKHLARDRAATIYELLLYIQGSPTARVPLAG